MSTHPTDEHDEAVHDRLGEVAQMHDIDIISAKLRGSRARGVAHDDSDVDVMFIFAQDPVEYVQIGGSVDSIHDPDEPVDLHGWSIRKFARHILESNPDAVECCQFPKEYLPGPGSFREVQRNAVENFNHMALYHHYLSKAKSNYSKYVAGEERAPLGRQFHVIDAVTRARYIRLHGELPPSQTLHMTESSYIPEGLSDAVVFLGSGKRQGRGDELWNDMVGTYLDEEEGAEMWPTDERTTSPSRELVNEFIMEALYE